MMQRIEPTSNKLERETSELLRAVTALDIPDITHIVDEFANTIDALILHMHQHQKLKCGGLTEDELIQVKTFFEESMDSLVLLQNILYANKASMDAATFVAKKYKIEKLVNELKTEVLKANRFCENVQNMIINRLKEFIIRNEADSDTSENGTMSDMDITLNN